MMKNTQDINISEEVEKYFDDSSISKTGEPELILLTGGICTGKTTARKQYFSTGFVLIDAAEIFLSLSGDEYYEFGAAFEEPLEIIGSLVAQRAIREKRNIVTEIIGASSEEIIPFLESMSSAGYVVHLRQITCDREVAWQRNVERGADNISAYYTEPYHLRWLMDATGNESA